MDLDIMNPETLSHYQLKLTNQFHKLYLDSSILNWVAVLQAIRTDFPGIDIGLQLPHGPYMIELKHTKLKVPPDLRNWAKPHLQITLQPNPLCVRPKLPPSDPVIPVSPVVQDPLEDRPPNSPLPVWLL